MNLKSISTPELLKATKRLASEEKRIGIEVLHHLREIDARKAFAPIGFSSLFDYCIRELRYAEGSACRRIAAMRLLREIPEYESKLEEGSVNVATLSKAHTFFALERKDTGKEYSKEEKMDVLRQIEGKSVRQAEQFFRRSLRNSPGLKPRGQLTRNRLRSALLPTGNYWRSLKGLRIFWGINSDQISMRSFSKNWPISL
jgi:hypothetical protein